MEIYFALLALCTEISQVTGEFPSQKPVTWIFDVFFDLHLNKRLSKQSEAGDLRRHRAHYDVIAMRKSVVCESAMINNEYTIMSQNVLQLRIN